MGQPLHIKGARIWDGSQADVRDLYTSDVVLDKPAPSSLVVDLDGYTIFPGLINAHDHLELNHYPRTKFREVYNNASEWSQDVNARLDTEPYKSLRAYPLWDRLFIGGLKNLLCGATTVAHHGPPHKQMFRRDFPVRVLRKYGWAHSLYLNTDEEIVASYRSTPPDVPWFIHLAEGADEAAAGEFKRLKALRCVGRNTVIVHGVGLTLDDIVHTSRVASGLVWCPSTNLYLLGKAVNAFREWVSTTSYANGRSYPSVSVRRNRGMCALGSDSRLTSVDDLLGELRTVVKIRKAWLKHHTSATVPDEHHLNSPTQLDESDYTAIVDLVALTAAHLLEVDNVGHLQPGAKADLLLLRSSGGEGKILCHSRRADLALVVKGGVPQIGDPEVMAKFPHVQMVRATLDGVEKAIHIDLARRIMQCKLREPGLEVDALPTGNRFWLK